MDKEKILEKVIKFVDQHESVTVFQIAYETGLTYGDVLNAFKECINIGILEETASGEEYSVIPTKKRLSLQEKTKQKMVSILDKLSEQEIKFLKDVMDNHTRSEVNKACEEKEEFDSFVQHFITLGLFDSNSGKRKLALTEEEYHFFWNALWDYPKKVAADKQKEEKKQTSSSNSQRRFLSIDEILAKRGITVSPSVEGNKSESSEIKHTETIQKNEQDLFPKLSEETLARVSDIKWQALWYCVDANSVSCSYLQRKMKKGYSSVNLILEKLADEGYISKVSSDRARREILIKKEDFYRELKERFGV